MYFEITKLSGESLKPCKFLYFVMVVLAAVLDEYIPINFISALVSSKKEK